MLVLAATSTEFPELLAGLVVTALLVTELRQVARSAAAQPTASPAVSE